MSDTEITTARHALREIRRLANDRNTDAFRVHLWNCAEHIRRYLLSFHLENVPSQHLAQYVNDALPRFLRTLEFVPLPPGQHILEIGSNPYLFHLLLNQLFRDCRLEGVNFFDHNIFSTDVKSLTQLISSAEFEESYTFTSTLLNIDAVQHYPFPDASFDLVFFCETLEHLIVDPLSTFAKLRRIIKPGGHILVTLPNAVRLTNLALMLDGHNFFDLYSSNGPNGRHNREYTLSEIVHLLEQNSYKIVRAETYDRFDYDRVDVWSNDYSGPSVKVSRNKTQILDILRATTGKTRDRGDNIYVLAKLPVPSLGVAS